jgi:HD superfamily phosphohydrolase
VAAKVTDLILNHPEAKATRSLMRDPIWKDIYLSERVRALIHLDVFQELQHISQVNTKQLVYPGINYSTFGHSIGVYCLAKKMIVRVARREPERLPLTLGLDPQPRFETTETDAHPELEGLQLGSIASDILTRSLDVFFAAALLHDIGKMPFSRAIRELKRELRRENSSNPQYIQALDKNLVVGRRRSAEFIYDRRSTEVYDELTSPEGGWGFHHIHIKRIANVVSNTDDYFQYDRGTKIDDLYRRHDMIFKLILYGPVGINEVDYLMRDSYYSRKDSAFDVNRLLDNMVPDLVAGQLSESAHAQSTLTRQEEQRQVIGVLSRGRHELESYFAMKNILYKAVYWQAAIRVLDVMMKIVLKEILREHHYSLREVEEQFSLKKEELDLLQEAVNRAIDPTASAVVRFPESAFTKAYDVVRLQNVFDRVRETCERDMVRSHNVSNEKFSDFVQVRTDALAQQESDLDGMESELTALKVLAAKMVRRESYEEIVFCRGLQLRNGLKVRELGKYFARTIQRRVKDKVKGERRHYFDKHWNLFSIIVDIKEVAIDEELFDLSRLFVLFPHKRSMTENERVNAEPYHTISPLSVNTLADLAAERNCIRVYCDSNFFTDDEITRSIVDTVRGWLEDEEHKREREEFLEPIQEEPLKVVRSM